MALLAIADPAVRAARIEEHVAQAAAMASGARGLLLAACFDAMLELTEDQGIPLLVRAIPLLDGASLDLHGRALTVAARLGWGELVPDIIGPLRARLATASADVLRQVLSPCLRSLRALGLRDDLATLLAALEPFADLERHLAAATRAALTGRDDLHDEDLGLRLVHAGGLAFIGDPRGRELLDARHAFIESLTHPTQRLGLIRDVAWGYAHGPVDLALERVAQLAPAFERVTDAFGTNSHFCLSVLHFVDSLVQGITGLADDNPREPGPA